LKITYSNNNTREEECCTKKFSRPNHKAVTRTSKGKKIVYDFFLN